MLRIRWFDPIAEVSALPDYSRGAPLLRLFGDRRASYAAALAVWLRTRRMAVALPFGDWWLSFTLALSSSPGHAPAQEERHFAAS